MLPCSRSKTDASEQRGACERCRAGWAVARDYCEQRSGYQACLAQLKPRQQLATADTRGPRSQCAPTAASPHASP